MRVINVVGWGNFNWIVEVGTTIVVVVIGNPNCPNPKKE